MGVEFKVVSRTLAVPIQAESVEQFVEKTNGFDALNTLQDKATVPLQWLEMALPRLSSHEQDMMLRHKVIPYVWLPQCTIYGVATEAGLQWARAQGLSVVGRIKLEDYRSLVRRSLGRRLLSSAVHGLERALPWASARTRMTGLQVLSLLAAMGLLLVISQVFGLQPIWGVAHILVTAFFCLVVGLRCLCLLPLPKSPGVVAPLLPRDKLPIYTVLVPLFRETEVLPQLLKALSSLDYSALCIKSTKICESQFAIYPQWNSHRYSTH